MFALSLAFLLSAPPIEPTTPPEELVRLLGAPKFKDRELAEALLVQHGAKALSAVRKGIDDPDAEISARCTGLWPKLYRLDMDLRVKAFLDDPKAKLTSETPGAILWKATLGDSETSVELYRKHLKEMAPRFVELETKKGEEHNLYIEHLLGIYPRVRVTPVGGKDEGGVTEADFLTFLFLGAQGKSRDPRMNLIGPGVSYYSAVYPMFNSPTFKDLINKSDAHRKLYVSWLKRERYITLVRRGLELGIQAKIPEMADLGLEFAKDKAVPITTSYIGLLAFGHTAKKEDFKKLEEFFKDKTQVGGVIAVGNGEQASAEIRDIALGAAIQMFGLDMKDFGYARTFPKTATVTFAPSYIYFAFANDAQRDAAYKKFEDFLKEKHPEIELPRPKEKPKEKDDTPPKKKALPKAKE